MQIKDLFEQTPAPISNAPTAPGGDEDVGKLTAAISSLQKQVADLQKSALQQSTAQQAAQQKPGEAGQQQQATGTVAPGKDVSGQEETPADGQAGGMLDAIKKLAGLGGAQQKPATPAAPAVKPQAPGVNQPPGITNLKIKQDLAKSQGKSV